MRFSCEVRGAPRFREVAEQLPNRFEAAWLGIEKDLRTQMTELVRGENDAGSPPCICLDQPSDGGLAFGRAVGIDEQPIGPTPNDFGRNAVAVLDQHLCSPARDVKRHVRLVLHLGRSELQARDGVRLCAHKQMNVKRQWDQVLQPQRYVTQDAQCERRLRLCQRAEIWGLPSDFRPQSVREIMQALQDDWIIELAQKSLVLVGKAGLRHGHLAHKPFQLGVYSGIDPHPLAGDLGKSLGEAAVEGIFSTVRGVIALAQNELKRVWTNEIRERLDRRKFDARSDERRDRGMYLDTAQFERSGGKRTRTRVNVEHIGPRAPGQVVVDALAELDREQVPIYSFGRNNPRPL